MYELFFRHAVSDTLQDPRNGRLVICRRLVIPYSLDVPSGKRRVVRGRRIPSTLHDTVIKLLTFRSGYCGITPNTVNRMLDRLGGADWAKRKGRASVPSWDDVMFGTTRD